MSAADWPNSVTIGDQVFQFPFINLVPRPSAEEYAALRDSIADVGIQEPVVLWEKDGEAIVINGHTRLIIAADLGLKIGQVPWTPMEYTSEEEARLAAVLTNALRREFTREGRLKTVRRLFQLKWSQRQIGRALGVGPGQVHYDLVYLGLIVKESPAPDKPVGEANAERSILNAPGGPVPDQVSVQGDVAPAEDQGALNATGATQAPVPSPSLTAAPPEAPGERNGESAPRPPQADPKGKALQRARDAVKTLAKAASELGIFDAIVVNLKAIDSRLERMNRAAG